MEQSSFISKLKNIIRDKKLDKNELFLISSSYYQTDEELYKIVMSFANDADFVLDIPNLKIKDIPVIRKAANSLFRKIERKEI